MRTYNEFQDLGKMIAWVERRETGPNNFHFAIQTDPTHADFHKCKVGMLHTCQSIRMSSIGNVMVVPYHEVRQWAAERQISVPVLTGGKPATAKPATAYKPEDADVIDTVTDSKPLQPVQPVQPVQQRTVVYGAGEAIAGANAIATLIQSAINQAMNIDDIKALAETKINDAVRNLMAPTIISVQQAPDQEPIPVGSVHKAFPVLLQAMSARSRSGRRLNICLVGPAGTGKSTAAEQAATAIGLPFYPYSAIDSKFEIIGFRDAQGQVVRTSFREACEFGGVVLFDEMSASSANARLALNAILANRIATFPDGPMKLHADCIILGGDNVIGGATAAYNGRHKPDASSIDRWVYLDWDIDTTLERVIAGNDSWTDIVAKVRAQVDTQGIRDVLITPRSSETGAALLAQGMDIKAVARMTLKKNMSEEQWLAVCAKVAELR